MFIKRTVHTRGGSEYVNHLLVESVNTPSGSRHRVICNLGKLDPGPRKQWLELAERIQAALSGQPSIFPDPRVDEAVRRARTKAASSAGSPPSGPPPIPDVLPVKTSGVRFQDTREAGPLHVGHQMWQRLRMDAVLKAVGLAAPARVLTEVMTLNRLIEPCSELAMVDWAKRAAISDVLGQDVSKLNEDRFYRNLDKLHGKRVQIETELHARETSLFNLNGHLLFYDLTNTYFEGKVLATPKAKRGHSKEKRSDCKLIAMGLMLDGDGFPIGHEIFEGNTQDGKTVEAMLDAQERRTGRKGGVTVVMDRGLASEDNLKLIRLRGYEYLVAGFQQQRGSFHDEFEELDGWEEIQPSVIRSPIQIKRLERPDAVFLLCVSPARAEKDRAIREKQEARWLKELEKLSTSVKKAKDSGNPMQDAELHERIGRLRERHSRVARYYAITREEECLVWQRHEVKHQRAVDLDGAYFLKTSRRDMDAEEIWRTYTTLTRVESAFRDLKSTLDMRPVYHRKETRVETHIFLCVLAYHLQVAIEHTLHEAGDSTSWEFLREELSTHQTATIVLPTADGRTLAIRRCGVPETRHREIYRMLGIPAEMMTPIRTWI